MLLSLRLGKETGSKGDSMVAEILAGDLKKNSSVVLQFKDLRVGQ